MFKRAGVYWCCIRHNGGKIQKSLETSDRKLAQAIEAKIRTEIIEGSYFEKLIGRNKTFKDMMERFMAIHAPKVAVCTQKAYSSHLKNLVSFFDDTKLVNISPKIISEYKVVRNDEGAAPASVNRELSMLSKAFNLAVREWEWLKDNPVSRVPKDKENNERDRWLTVEEEKRFFDNCPERLSEIVIFALNTGLRQGELLSLQWSRVNFIRKTILIQITKSGKPRTIPLNRFALELLKKKFEEKVRSIQDIVFVNKVGKKMCPSKLRKDFNKVLIKAEIENFKFHDLRHTFATRLAQKGIDIYTIAKLLGHVDIKMTQRYAHHCPESLRSGVEILEVDYNLTTVPKKESSNHV
jgi:integrase